MKILHTADWHIGQLFHEYDRTYEHQRFLDWLIRLLGEEAIDVVLISGDVFDLSNPGAVSVKLFYTFLSRAVKVNPAIQIVITAGNHDSASRLEAPKPLLESSSIHIIGLVDRENYDKLVVPLRDKAGVVKAWCMAIPFLRMGDYPVIADCANPYAEGVTALYKAVYEYAAGKKEAGQAIIAMGHLHAQRAEVTDMDTSERQIMGGVECISAGAFPEGIRYVALGHIHKAQRIGGNEHVRYSGSPIPMSFSEVNYKHQVVVFELEGEVVRDLRSIEVPLAVELLRVPAVHSRLEDVVGALGRLPVVGMGDVGGAGGAAAGGANAGVGPAEANAGSGVGPAPYLEVRVLLDGPEPALRYKIEAVLADKWVRLARIDVRYPVATAAGGEGAFAAQPFLHELQPLDVFTNLYQLKYNNPAPAEMLQLFNAVAQEVSQKEM